jgi:tyrosyl-tRNA synthetase
MNTDEQIDILITKGVEQILPNTDFLKKELNSGKKLTLYCGFDPTAPTLHIGHAITLRKLKQFQDLGHQVIFLIGDFTARAGDPTDKSIVRKLLSEKEIKTNLKLYKKQASSFIRFSGKNKALVKFNNDWLGKMKFADVLFLASQMTVDQMQKRDMFIKRHEEGKPVYIHEFLYPLMQGYDSVAMNVDGEVGGNDQLFNMLAGRTLLKQMKNKEKFVITMKLLADANGKKMSKTEGNMIALSDTPEEIYGKVMSWADSMMGIGFELCTDITESETSLILSGNPRDSKMKLAFEITKSVYGEKLANRAQDVFIKTFQKKEIPDEINEIFAEGDLAQTLIKSGLVSSNSDLRRLAEAGAITHLESEKVITFEDVKKAPEKGTYKIGKNRFIKIV